MRIRKRSISLLSHPSWEKKGGSICIGDGGYHEEEKAEKEEFLFPLLAAAMDVEAKAESALARDSTSKPSQAPEISEIGVHKRKWRNALVGFEANNNAVKQVSVGGDKSTCIRYGTRSISRGDKFQHPKIEACAMEGRSSSVEQEISGHDSKLVLPISGGCEKSLMSREREDDLGVDTVNKKRSNPNGADGDTKCNVMEHINARRKRSTKIWGDKGPESTGKASNIDNNKNKKNDDDDNGGSGSGSRCKRRNGRGWQCSQRTLVGYSLCEHHLGKARFTSINARDDRVAVNKKGGKFKDLHLVHAASPKVELA